MKKYKSVGFCSREKRKKDGQLQKLQGKEQTEFLMFKPSKQRDTVDNYKANNNKQQTRKALTLTTNLVRI